MIEIGIHKILHKHFIESLHKISVFKFVEKCWVIYYFFTVHNTNMQRVECEAKVM